MSMFNVQNTPRFWHGMKRTKRYLSGFFVKRDGSTPPSPDSDWDYSQSIVTHHGRPVTHNGEVVWHYEYNVLGSTDPQHQEA